MIHNNENCGQVRKSGCRPAVQLQTLEALTGVLLVNRPAVEKKKKTANKYTQIQDVVCKSDDGVNQF